MINFEEELKHFQPITEVAEAEDAINQKNITDITDIIAELMRKPGTNKKAAQKNAQKK